MIRPQGLLSSINAHLGALGPLDAAVISKSGPSFYGLAGKHSDKIKRRARELFMQLARCDRAPAGRVTGCCGRARGAEYYLNPKWAAMGNQMGKGRSAALVDDSEIFGERFAMALAAKTGRKARHEQPAR